jgi:two-component system, LytTR family, response regulator
MIRALIVDDEESGINVLQMLLQRHVPNITDVHVARGPSEGLKELKKATPDILFLDIEMPLMSGFDLLNEFPHHSFEVIFVTAYDHYAIKAIRFSALDYLLKPVDADELKRAVQRYEEKKKSNGNNGQLMTNFLNNIKTTPADYCLAIHTTEGTHFLKPEEIIRCEADGNYTLFILEAIKKIIASRTLKEFDEILADHHFLRVHKSHLVNRKYIQSFATDHLVLKDSSVVEVSRRRAPQIKEILNYKL